MKNTLILTCTLLILTFTTACNTASENSASGSPGIPVIFDTDANNELDDQHALAYMLLNDEVFDVLESCSRY